MFFRTLLDAKLARQASTAPVECLAKTAKQASTQTHLAAPNVTSVQMDMLLTLAK